jgi:DNA sulfur modification protein DndB
MPYIFSVIRGEQKQITFYQTNLEYGEIDSLVKLPEDLVLDQLLASDTEMQRKLSWTRVKKELVPYLVDRNNSFYSALTLLIIPRNFEELVEGEGYDFTPSKDDTEVGHLKIYSSCFLFAADGQHRAASIKEAIRQKPNLASQKVPVVLMLFKSKSQARQLFSDLNMNAKPISKSIGLSLETRDPMAIITKDVEQIVPLFKDRVNHDTNSLSASADKVITLNVLYNCNDRLREALKKSLDELENNEIEIESTAQAIADIWNVIIDATPVWTKFQNGTIEKEKQQQNGKKKQSVPGFMRDNYLCALALGWQAIAGAASEIVKDNLEAWQPILRKAMQCTNWHKTNPDWQQICLTGDKITNSASTIKATTGYIFEQAGIDSEKTKPYLDALNEMRQLRRISKDD